MYIRPVLKLKKKNAYMFRYSDGKIHVDEMVDFMNKDPEGFEYLGLNLIFLS